MANFIRTYTEEERIKVLSLFYRGKREGEVVVDNRDSTISKELGIKQHIVSTIISNDLNKKFKNINNN